MSSNLRMVLLTPLARRVVQHQMILSAWTHRLQPRPVDPHQAGMTASGSRLTWMSWRRTRGRSRRSGRSSTKNSRKMLPRHPRAPAHGMYTIASMATSTGRPSPSGPPTTSPRQPFYTERPHNPSRRRKRSSSNTYRRSSMRRLTSRQKAPRLATRPRGPMVPSIPFTVGPQPHRRRRATARASARPSKSGLGRTVTRRAPSACRNVTTTHDSGADSDSDSRRRTHKGYNQRRGGRYDSDED